MSFTNQPGRLRWDRDPLYVRNRAIIRAQRRPCARCGRPIAYDQPYWLIGPTGRRKVNPWAFHCGHVIARHRGGGHELSNLQAEHAGCSIRDGARESNGHNGGPVTRQGVIPNLDTSKRW